MPLYFNWKKFKFWKDGDSKNSLRRYYIIAATYLLVIVVVFSLMVLRWGPSTAPSWPESQLQQLDPPLEQASPDVAHEEQPLEDNEKPAEIPDSEAVPDEDALSELNASYLESTLLFPQSYDDGGDSAKKPELPAAAPPLHHWDLYTSFGKYGSMVLPSGGLIHHLSRGVLLKADPGSSVAVLWDGVVRKVAVMEGLYRCSVLVEHEGGYSSYYGNLREVWVKEGAFVSRGENIGMMPYSNRGNDGESAHALPVSGNIPTAGRPLQMRTIYSGPLPEEGKSVEAFQPQPQQQEIPALLPPEEQKPVPHNPLLYLEVRHNTNFLDPLNFIRVRN